MADKVPILLSFYGLSNGTTTLVFGQLSYTSIRDLTFSDFNRRKTFRTLFRLYHAKPYANQSVTLVFEHGAITVSTNSFGGFYVKANASEVNGILKDARLPSGEAVKIADVLYDRAVRNFSTDTIVVSDIDDTLMHSFIYRKLRKMRTMMFTTVEKRKSVEKMQELVKSLTDAGAAAIYLSNSEQNLYPMIYRFLSHNHFTPGPLFLKQMRSLWDVIWNIKFPLRDIHKSNTIEDLITLFPDKRFVFIGDNTQRDLPIYLNIAKKYPERVKAIMIRKVVEKKSDHGLIDASRPMLNDHKIAFFYERLLPPSLA